MSKVASHRSGVRWGLATGVLSLLAAGAAVAAPAVGDRFIVGGRCVAVTSISGQQAHYSWREGNRSGSGNLPASALNQRCDALANAATAAPVDEEEDDDDHDAMEATPATTPTPTTTAPATAPTTPPAPTGSPGFAEEILRAHNQLRCVHGAPPLQWHPEVAAYAQRWAERGEFQHSDNYNSPLGPMGENLYGSSGLPSATQATQSWYGEIAKYAYGEGGSNSTGHFTAMVWKDVKYLGCGRARGIISCNYWSGTRDKDCSVPNMGGCYAQQVVRPNRDAGACR